MAKKISANPEKSRVQDFLKDLQFLYALPISAKYKKLALPEYPFDNQLLHASRLYRDSRAMYLELGGTFQARVCSTMRALSAQDLFKDEIDFTPSESELVWFKNFAFEVSDPEEEILSLTRFNEISLFHEQNHRVIWRLLPPAPSEQADLCRYLNFAESLVVMIDLALGDELGAKNSAALERLRVIYRPGGIDTWAKKSKTVYRNYLLALLAATYYNLEQMHTDDILKAVDYIFPGQKKMNKDAVNRSLELSELFSRVTNPLWQDRYWKDAGLKLKKIHAKSKEEKLYMPEDPLDLEAEFFFANKILDYYGL